MCFLTIKIKIIKYFGVQNDFDDAQTAFKSLTIKDFYLMKQNLLFFFRSAQMHSIFICISLSLLALVQYQTVDAKIYSRCEIANELKKHSFPMTFISSCMWYAYYIAYIANWNYITFPLYILIFRGMPDWKRERWRHVYG